MIHGILLADKPSGPTSHDVVGKIRATLHIKKVGHAGTLDPFATGLLVVMIGYATRLSDALMADEKVYEARLRWGEQTDTGDCDGQVIERTDAPIPDEGAIRDAMAGFVGTIMQTPPAYSAKKLNGKPSYKLAREGKEVERKPVPVTVHDLALIAVHEDGFSFSVRCGKGLYVRTLGEEIAHTLGGRGHLCALRRLSIGDFSVGDAIAIPGRNVHLDENKVKKMIIPLENLCNRFPAVHINDDAAARVRYGQIPTVGQIKAADPFVEGQWVRMLGFDRQLLAVCQASRGFSELQKLEPEEKFLFMKANFSASEEPGKK